MKKRSLILAIFIIIYDQIIKYFISSHFYDGKIVSVIDRFLYITKVHNDGAAWSILSGNQIILIAVSIIALIFLVWLEGKFVKKRYVWIAFGLVYGGLVGNMIDRIINNYVIDYIKVVLFGYNYPIFNLADIAIVVGFIMIMIGIFLGEDQNDN